MNIEKIAAYAAVASSLYIAYGVYQQIKQDTQNLETYVAAGLAASSLVLAWHQIH